MNGLAVSRRGESLDQQNFSLRNIVERKKLKNRVLLILEWSKYVYSSLKIRSENCYTVTWLIIVDSTDSINPCSVSRCSCFNLIIIFVVKIIILVYRGSLCLQEYFVVRSTLVSISSDVSVNGDDRTNRTDIT